MSSVSYQILAAVSQVPVGAEPFREWIAPDGTVWISFYRAGKGYRLRFPGFADFIVSSNGQDVLAYPVGGVSQQTIEHLFLNQVLPLALGRQFKLVFHGSAVEIEDFALVFMGASGRGKSTLAASFATSGFRFLTDDGLQIDNDGKGPLVKPSHPSIRLWEDSSQALIPRSAELAPPVEFTPKSRFLAGDEVVFCNSPRPVRRIYFLGEGSAQRISIEPLSARDAMVELARHSFVLDIDARDMLSHHFGQLAALAATPVFFRLDYPREYKALPQVREAVIEHANDPRY